MFLVKKADFFPHNCFCIATKIDNTKTATRMSLNTGYLGLKNQQQLQQHKQ